ncbi:SAM-dependent methyltransferase [Pseudonocardia humida]|uniref:SAM-dependent methyltransferase n=1 Tax=Pseudonocardia humida TaxID=2800819 RepID=A0ABT1A2Z6_9PSEU|nr:SAM-dependent methyltransferase [Pseudonocardia humida]MCO1657336.1 SAM-dependent methyltransferase [Pseudonocardia humida]
MDASRPHPVRVHNYWLGGKDNYAADRELGDAMIAELPGLAMMAREHRRFMERAVRHLATEVGLSQYVLLGSGLPTSYNLHQVAQEVEPLASVVYVDSDPVVAAHSRALLVSHPKGSVSFVPGDVTEPAALLDDPALTGAVDLRAPVAVALSSTLMRHSDEEARAILDVLIARLAPGSHLVITHPTADFDPAGVERAMQVGNAVGLDRSARSQAQVLELFAGLELLDPGVVPIMQWRPDGSGPRRDARRVHLLGGVGRRP